MEKEKMVAFVKNHKKEIAIGVGAAVLGVVIGKKVYGSKTYTFHTNNKVLYDLINKVHGSEFFTATDTPYKLAELGKLGEDMMDRKHNADYTVTNILAFRPRK